MNGTTPDQERTPASEPVWERPWSVEEIHRSSQRWSLAADAGLRGWPQGPEGRAGRLGWPPACELEDGALIPSTSSAPRCFWS
ncbi:WASH complex subunit 2-like [Manis javanica]|uniref:WASH complex subunit 2-like n=1 Tax=Manis javanica TaxID=9974 RepID=UPI003C6DA67A